MDFKAISDPVILVSDNTKKPAFFQKIRPPSNNFFKNKKILGGALTVLFLFAVGIGVYLNQKPTQLAPQASELVTEISIKPSNQAVNLNQEFESQVFLDTKDLSVTAADVTINFDPGKLQLLQVTLGDFLPLALMQPASTASSTHFIVGTNPSKKGSGNLATLRFKLISNPGSTPVSIGFDQSQTEVAALEGNSQNVASGFYSSQITLAISGSPSPSTQSSPSGSAISHGKGDGNGDGKVDIQDLSVLYSRWSIINEITGSSSLDLNNDRFINSLDYALLVQLLISLGVLKPGI